MTFNESRTQECIMHIDPFAKEEDFEKVEWKGAWDLVLKRDGRIIYYNAYNNTSRMLPYDENTYIDEERFKKEFAFRMEIMMQRRFMSQKMLADKIGTTQQMISVYLTGKSIPGVYVMYKMANALNCTIDDLTYRFYL